MKLLAIFLLDSGKFIKCNGYDFSRYVFVINSLLVFTTFVIFNISNGTLSFATNVNNQPYLYFEKGTVKFIFAANANNQPY